MGSQPDFVYSFSRKMFLVLYSISWPNFIGWLPLLLGTLVNICIVIVCFIGCDVINFEINHIFLIKQIFYIIKNSRQKSWKRREISMSNKRDFKRLFSCQKMSHTRECAFNTKMISRSWSSWCSADILWSS